MSTPRCSWIQAISAVALVACSSPAGPKAPPSAPAPAPVIVPAVAVHDPACSPAPAPPDEPDPDAEHASHAPDPGQARDDEPTGERGKPRPVNACTVVDRNIFGDEAAILAAPHPAARAAPAFSAWDHRTPPARLELIKRRFELAGSELAQLQRTGVVVPARLEMPSYTYSYHEIFQSQLPVYITADSIFHAIFASHDSIVEKLELATLAPLLSAALDRMHCALPAASAAYPADTARDLDLYLTVARSLFADEPVKSIRGDAAVDREAAALLAQLHAAAGVATVTMFGRPRLVDFTQYTPRGHYAKSEDLKRYFAAAMWASRLELNLVSRSSRSSAPGPAPDPSETPREAIDALALADLATQSGAAPGLATVDQAWGLLTGRREDVSLAELQQLRQAAQITSLTQPAAFAQLKQAIGARFQRTVRMHPMPEGSTVLPAIATLIGARVVPDAQALMPLIDGRGSSPAGSAAEGRGGSIADAVAGRKTVHAADVVYSLGLDRAKHYLASDLAAFPALAGQLDVARKLVHDVPATGDLYSAWLAAIRALAEPAAGAVPSFLTGEVGGDLRFNTIATAYGQLKHNYVLMAGQTYSDFGCEIPDGYIEPVPAAYDALIEYAVRGAKLSALLDPARAHPLDGRGSSPAVSAAEWRGGSIEAYFERTERTLRVLRAIVGDELANRPLTQAERRWIGMVAELSVDDSQDITGFPPVYSGWYFDLFPEAQDDGMRAADYVADYFTSSEQGIAYVGASAPRLGIFVVDTNGAPRAFVGPVARGYETHTPIATRLTDDAAARLPHVDEPWAASYTAANPAARPRLDVHYDHETGDVTVKADPALGPVTVKLLDHHRGVIATRRQALRAGDTVFPFHKKGPWRLGPVGAVYVQAGAFRDWALGNSYNDIAEEWGKPPEPDAP